MNLCLPNFKKQVSMLTWVLLHSSTDAERNCSLQLIWLQVELLVLRWSMAGDSWEYGGIGKSPWKSHPQKINQRLPEKFGKNRPHLETDLKSFPLNVRLHRNNRRLPTPSKCAHAARQTGCPAHMCWVPSTGGWKAIVPINSYWLFMNVNECW